jgi:hypothetical protein
MRALKARTSGAGARVHLGREAYLHILSGEHNTRSLATLLSVSVPSAARAVEALRAELARDHRRLVSVRSEGGWHYEIRDQDWPETIERDSLVTGVVRGRRRGGVRLSEEDADTYGRD